MFGAKTFTPRLNSETFLLFALLGLVLLSTAITITFVYGISFTFTSIFLFLLFRLYGLPIAILAGLLTFLCIPFELTDIGDSTILLLEIIFVGVYFLIKKRAKMFFVDALFWFTLGLVLLFIFNQNVLSDEALYFEVSKRIFNGLFNVLIADMLLAYLPFYKLLNKSIPLNKNNVSIHQFLSHITIISIMIPFFILVMINAWHAQELIVNQAVGQAESSFQRIKKELLLLNKDGDEPLSRINKKMDDIIEENNSIEYDIIITDLDNKLITSTLKNYTPTEYDFKNKYEVKSLGDNFYEALPKEHLSAFPILKWRSGHLVYEQKIDAFSMKIFFQFPISQYQDEVFKNFIIHLAYSSIFALCTIFFVLATSLIFMKNLSQLTAVTTGLPRKLIKLENVEWPQASISELRLLTQNLKEMADKLSELFRNSIKMNAILTEQTKMLKESEDKLHELAFYDALTSLPNRLHFQKYVRELIKNYQTGYIAIIFIDLNQFKQINDTLGHDVGDALLEMTANKLRTLHGPNREIFRLGGDEFVIVHQVGNQSEIESSLNQMNKEFSSPIKINEQLLYITISAGISIYPKDGEDLNTLVKYADIAMYVSKEKGGNAFQFFNDTMRGKFQERLLVENSLRKAVDNTSFELFYQPKLQHGKVTSLEALLRWNDSELGPVPPPTFIPVAEDTGLIVKIDEWVLLKACLQNKKWQDEGLLKVPIAVNISAKNFQHDYLVNLIKSALSTSGLSPEYLKIEMTESVFIKNPNHVAEVIKEIKRMGVLISIDDFGKGFSSLNQLLHLPIDEIKIDRQFISGIDKHKKKALLVKSIFEIAHGFNLNVVAEGVESVSERDLLIEMGCDEMQGYLFSPPISEKELREYIAERK